METQPLLQDDDFKQKNKLRMIVIIPIIVILLALLVTFIVLYAKEKNKTNSDTPSDDKKVDPTDSPTDDKKVDPDERGSEYIPFASWNNCTAKTKLSEFISKINSLENYQILTVSPELRKNDYEEIIKYTNPKKVEILVQGHIELMKSRYPLLYGNENKMNYKNYLIDEKNNYHPLHKSISNEELIIFSDRQLSLIREINYLKSIGYCNFAIDGRFMADDYHKIIGIYKEALNGNVNIKELEKYSLKNTSANY